MTVLVTGAAGFIGYHIARKLAERGETVVGIDNLNEYYGKDLKRRRLVQLSTFPNFRFHKTDLSERGSLESVLAGERPRLVIHLAAQANVRYGIENPHAYADSNLVGHLNVLEFCRHTDSIEALVYASSSSVYGARNAIPFREDGETDRPTSLYAATKKSQEMMSAVYAEMFALPQIGLRFFSVYGPWGRPDMAYWLFTDSIIKGKPIKVFNNGEMHRDFTYIDDIVAGVLAVADAPRLGDDLHRIYNLGSSRPVSLMDMISTLETILGRRAQIEFAPLQPGEMTVTYADISAIASDYGFRPRTSLEDGLKRFVEWFRRYQQMR